MRLQNFYFIFSYQNKLIFSMLFFLLLPKSFQFISFNPDRLNEVFIIMSNSVFQFCREFLKKKNSNKYFKQK